MYEALRQRAPNSSKAAGVASTVLMTALVGYALANGLGAEIVKVIPSDIVLTLKPSPPVEPPPTPDKIPIEDHIDLPIPTSPIPDDIFVPIDDSGLIVERGPVDPVEARPAVTNTAPARKAPKLVSEDKPPYPTIAIRGRDEGSTGLNVCVDATGRVTSASLAQSSGHARLDDAALKWVRGARFTPGSVGGAPQSMCGHSVVYEWKLEDAAR